MNEILMIYQIPKGDASTRIQFNRKLFCYKIQSNSGKFKKLSNGVLEKFKKPIRSTVIFDKSKLFDVEKICEKFKIKAEFYEIKKITN